MTIFKPQSRPYIPRSFQEKGIVLGVSQACAGFFLAPGLGKTTIIYSIFKILKDAGFVKRMLVICPLKPAMNVWPRQKNSWNEFKDLDVVVLHGKNKEALLQEDHDIYVVNPEGLSWLFGEYKNTPDTKRLKYVTDKMPMLYVDESHKFKDTSTNRFKLMRHVIPKFKRRYIGTGTLNPEGLENVFGQIFLLDEGAALGKYITRFRAQYFHQKPWDKYSYFPNLGAFEQVAEKVAPYCLVVGRDQIPDLPPVVFDDRMVELPAAAQRLYDQAERDLLIAIEGNAIVAANAAVASSKCRQICNGFVYDNQKVATSLHQEKLDNLVELIEELNGEPLIVTYEFQEDRDQLLAELKCPNISSGNAKKDDETIQRFRRGAYPVVIGSTASISLGIDGLQDVCGHMFMYGITWKLSDYIQVIDRIRRQGSSHTSVVIHRCLASGTVDERVVRKLDENEGEMIDFMEVLKSLRA
jgi:hypothetical protein